MTLCIVPDTYWSVIRCDHFVVNWWIPSFHPVKKYIVFVPLKVRWIPITTFFLIYKKKVFHNREEEIWKRKTYLDFILWQACGDGWSWSAIIDPSNSFRRLLISPRKATEFYHFFRCLRTLKSADPEKVAFVK